MATTLSTIRDGLKTRLATITSLRPYDVWPDSPNLPAAIVRPTRRSFTSLASRTSIWFEIVLLMPIANLVRAQDLLDGYLDVTGASSVMAAIEADGTLGGAAEDVNVTGWRDYGPMEVGEVTYFGAVIDVEVYALD